VYGKLQVTFFIELKLEFLFWVDLNLRKPLFAKKECKKTTINLDINKPYV
jgi:hypothetical protein